MVQSSASPLCNPVDLKNYLLFLPIVFGQYFSFQPVYTIFFISVAFAFLHSLRKQFFGNLKQVFCGAECTVDPSNWHIFLT